MVSVVKSDFLMAHIFRVVPDFMPAQIKILDIALTAEPEPPEFQKNKPEVFDRIYKKNGAPQQETKAKFAKVEKMEALTSKQQESEPGSRNEWFVFYDGQKTGPVSFSEAVSLVLNVTSSTALIKREIPNNVFTKEFVMEKFNEFVISLEKNLCEGSKLIDKLVHKSMSTADSLNKNQAFPITQQVRPELQFDSNYSNQMLSSSDEEKEDFVETNRQPQPAKPQPTVKVNEVANSLRGNPYASSFHENQMGEFDRYADADFSQNQRKFNTMPVFSKPVSTDFQPGKTNSANFSRSAPSPPNPYESHFNTDEMIPTQVSSKKPQVNVEKGHNSSQSGENSYSQRAESDKSMSQTSNQNPSAPKNRNGQDPLRILLKDYKTPNLNLSDIFSLCEGSQMFFRKIQQDNVKFFGASAGQDADFRSQYAAPEERIANVPQRQGWSVNSDMTGGKKPTFDVNSSMKTPSYQNKPFINPEVRKDPRNMNFAGQSEPKQIDARSMPYDNLRLGYNPHRDPYAFPEVPRVPPNYKPQMRPPTDYYNSNYDQDVYFQNQREYPSEPYNPYFNQAPRSNYESFSKNQLPPKVPVSYQNIEEYNMPRGPARGPMRGMTKREPDIRGYDVSDDFGSSSFKNGYAGGYPGLPTSKPQQRISDDSNPYLNSYHDSNPHVDYQNPSAYKSNKYPSQESREFDQDSKYKSKKPQPDFNGNTRNHKNQRVYTRQS